MKPYIAIIVTMLALTGCRSSRPTTFVDMGDYEDNSALFEQDEDMLICSFNDKGPSKVVSVVPIINDDTIYLQIRRTSGMGPSQYYIDTASLRVSQGWEDRVYSFSRNGRSIERWKVNVTPAKDKKQP